MYGASAAACTCWATGAITEAVRKRASPVMIWFGGIRGTPMAWRRTTAR